jgi:hypothetical protein
VSDFPGAAGIAEDDAAAARWSEIGGVEIFVEPRDGAARSDDDVTAHRRETPCLALREVRVRKCLEGVQIPALGPVRAEEDGVAREVREVASFIS